MLSERYVAGNLSMRPMPFMRIGLLEASDIARHGQRVMA